MSAYHMSAGALGGQKRVWDPLELELQVVMSCRVGAEKQTQVLCRNSSALNHCLSLQPPEKVLLWLFNGQLLSVDTGYASALVPGSSGGPRPPDQEQFTE